MGEMDKEGIAKQRSFRYLAEAAVNSNREDGHSHRWLAAAREFAQMGSHKILILIIVYDIWRRYSRGEPHPGI
jgi:hypothetical protein